ncbi:MAG: CubicO group peptidase (beta-lactamase class C family) [Celeribacter sp.]|jgi:CubicO group peptidase (beta-lactamase class C family)
MVHSKNVIQRKMDRLVLTGQSAGVAVSAYRQRDGAWFGYSNGNLTDRRPYFGMGITYPFVVAILMQMADEGKLALDTPFVTYLAGQKACDQLHVMDGVDYTDQITIRHLLSHRTGFTDKFMSKKGGRVIVHEFMKGIDSKWNFDDVMVRARSHGAIYAPSLDQKPSFSDVHFHILGKIIEDLDGKPFAQSVQDRLAKPLGLSSTYVYCDPSDKHPAPLLTKKGVISVPLIMSSFQAESGIVTTSREGLIFMRAFFEGYLFNRKWLKEICDWHKVLPVMDYGLGMMNIHLPRHLTFAGRTDEPWNVFRRNALLTGHLGKNGTFMFWAPTQKIYVSGSVNKLGHLPLAMNLATRLVEAVDRDEISRTDSHGAKIRDENMSPAVFTMSSAFPEYTKKAPLGVFEAD